MIRSFVMVIVFYLINFSAWDFIVNRGLLSPNWASVLDYTILFIITLLLYGKVLKEEWHRFKTQIKSPQHFVLNLLIWSIVGSLLSGAFIYIFGNLLNINLMPENQENVNNMVDQIPAIFSFIMMGIYAPIIEEMTFRYSIIGWVDKKDKGLLIIMTILSVVLFDMIHVINLPEFWYYFPMALLLAGMYWKYDRNPWASIFFHSFFNIIGFIFIILGVINK